MHKEIEKSRPYNYGKDREFSTRDLAMSHALYKMEKMLEEIKKSTKINLDGDPKIVDVYEGVQVQIPIVWE